MQSQSSDTPDPFKLRERLGWTLLLVVLSAFGFLYIDSQNAGMGARPSELALETPLDAWVPFVPGFIFAYLLYYPWVLLPLIVLPDREPFVRAIFAFALMQLIAGTIFVFFPSHMVRPHVEATGLAADLTRMMFRLDMGWNVFPSLHVGHSSLVAMLFYRHERRLLPIVAVGSFFISISTVLIKQHYVVDIPAGLLLAWLCYWASGLSWPLAQSRSDSTMNFRAFRTRLVRERDGSLADQRGRGR